MRHDTCSPIAKRKLASANVLVGVSAPIQVLLPVDPIQALLPDRRAFRFIRPALVGVTLGFGVGKACDNDVVASPLSTEASDFFSASEKFILCFVFASLFSPDEASPTPGGSRFVVTTHKFVYIASSPQQHQHYYYRGDRERRIIININ
jgi:hypothetical protein